MNRTAIAAALTMSAAFPAHAQQGVTVDALLKQGYEVKAAFPSNAGPGLVLQKGAAVAVCFVAETPSSKDVSTQYCKPVH